MTPDVICPTVTFRPATRLPWSVAVVVVAVIEVLALSVRFDLGGIVGASGWWAEVLLQGPLLLKLVATAGVAGAFFCWSDIGAVLASRSDAGMRPGSLIGLVLSHLLAVSAGYWLMAQLVAEPTRPGGGNSGLFVTWVMCGAVAVATLALAVLPAAAWREFVGRTYPSLVVAGMVAFAAWGAALFSNRLWAPLGRSTLWAVWSVLSAVGADPVCVPELFHIGTGSFSVLVAPQCSGYEGIGLILAFVGGYVWAFRADFRFPHVLLLLPLGAALAWAANVLRIAALILIGHWGSRDVALGGFHSQAGWLTFNAIALGLVVFAHKLRRTAPARGQSAVVAPDLTTAYLGPFLVLLAVSMSTAALVAGFDWWYPLRVVAVGGVLWYFRRSYPPVRWSWAAVGLGLGVFGLWVVIAPPSRPSQVPADLPGWDGSAAAWIVVRLIGSCLTVPIAEELAFRGYLTRRLIAPRFERVTPGQFTWLSFVGSSVLFGLMHDRWLAGTLAGAVYALAYYRRGQLSDAVLAHATTNAALAAVVLGTGDWGLWS